jgi:hypothetical protein
VINGLQEIDFPGKLIGAAVATVWMQYQSVGGRDLPNLFGTLINEGKLAQRLAAAMAPGVETQLGSRITLWNHHAIRLHGAINP